MIFVTGGAGCISTNFVLSWLAQHNELIQNLGWLTYAGKRDSL